MPSHGSSRLLLVADRPALRSPSRRRSTRRGIDKVEADDMNGAAESLQAFSTRAATCGRARQALPGRVHRARPRLRAPGWAGARVDRLRRRARLSAAHARRRREGRRRARATQLVERRELQRRAGAGGAALSRRGQRRVQRALRDRSRSTSSPSSPGQGREPSCTRPSTSASTAAPRPGDHVLLVEAVHDCKPGFGALRALEPTQGVRVHQRRARPTTIEIRAYAEDGSATHRRTRRSRRRR